MAAEEESWIKILDITDEEIETLISRGASWARRQVLIDDIYYTHRGFNLRGMGIQWRLRWLKQGGEESAELAVKGPADRLDTGEEIRTSWRQELSPREHGRYQSILALLGFVPHTRRQKIRGVLGVELEGATIEIQVDVYPVIPRYAEVTGGSVEAQNTILTWLNAPSKRVTRATASGVFRFYGVEDSTCVLFGRDDERAKLFRIS